MAIYVYLNKSYFSHKTGQFSIIARRRQRPRFISFLVDTFRIRFSFISEARPRTNTITIAASRQTGLIRALNLRTKNKIFAIKKTHVNFHVFYTLIRESRLLWTGHKNFFVGVRQTLQYGISRDHKLLVTVGTNSFCESIHRVSRVVCGCQARFIQCSKHYKI